MTEHEICERVILAIFFGFLTFILVEPHLP